MKHSAIALLAVFACTADDAEPGYSLATDPTRDGYLEQRRLRMNLTATIDGAAQTPTARQTAVIGILPGCVAELAAIGTPMSALTDPDDVSKASDAVLPEEDDPSEIPAFQPLVSCDGALGQAEACICVSHRLLELQSTVSETTWTGRKLSGSTAADWVIPPQDAETGVALAQEAAWWARRAMVLAGENLRRATGASYANIGLCDNSRLSDQFGGNDGENNYGEAMVMLLAEGADLVEESVRRAHRGHLSVGDADFSRMPDTSIAAESSWLNDVMSRARAAHLVVGGASTSGLRDFAREDDVEAAMGSTEQITSVCPIGELSAEGERAREVLQAAAARPAVVYDEAVDFETLFEDGAGGDTSLRSRLAARTGDDVLETTTAAEYLELTGLTEEAFSEARAYMKHEALAFARDPLHQLPALPVASTRDGSGGLVPQFSTIGFYAATSTPPAPQPVPALASRARYSLGETAAALSDGVPTMFSEPLAIGPGYADKSLAHAIDYATSVAYQVNTSPGALSTKARDTLALFAGGATARRPLRLEVCGGSPNSTSYRIRIYGEQTMDEYDVVSGVSGLRCAVTGIVDGAECDVTDYLLGDAFGTITGSGGGTTSVAHGFNDYTDIAATISEASLANWPLDEMLFVVHREAGSQQLPGAYSPVGAFLAWDAPPGANWHYCTATPIVPDLDELIRAALEPSADYCGRGEQTCAGPAFSERIPLEDELNSDSDDYESSYKSFLRRAAESAAFADSLGEQLIEAGLELDRRIETATEELESVCGGPLSLGDLYFGSAAGARGGMCSAPDGEQGGCNAGELCRGGWCTVDPTARLQAEAESPSAQRLVDCIGDDSVIDYVSLGSRDLCIWVHDDTGEVCGEIEDVTLSCPYPADGLGNCQYAGIVDYPEIDADHEVIPVDTHLELFQSPLGPEIPPPDARVPPCAKIRALRHETVDEGEIEGTFRELRDSGFFRVTHLQEIARNVGFEARADDYATVTFAGASVYSTGNPFTDTAAAVASGSWPCGSSAHPTTEDEGDMMMPACPDLGTTPSELASSLFCSYTSSCAPGADRLLRAHMNHRLGQAVLALRILTGVGVGPGFTGPFLADPCELAYLGDPSERDNHEIAEHELLWTEGRDNVPFHDVPATRGATRATTVQLKVVEDDGLENDVGRWDVGGSATCFTGSDELWTAFDSQLGGSTTLYRFDCDTGMGAHKSCDEDGVPFFTSTEYWGLFFKRYGSPLLGDRAPDHAYAFLRGLGTNEEVTRPNFASVLTSYDGLLYWLLRQPHENPDYPVVDSARAVSNELTLYWHEGEEGDQGNQARIAPHGLSQRAMLDALELACELDTQEGDVSCADAPPPEPTSLRDLGAARRYLECIGTEIEQQAEREVLSGLPNAVLSARRSSVRLEGTRGQAAANVADLIESLNGYKRDLGAELRGFALDIADVRSAAAANELQLDLIDLNVTAETIDRGAACASAVAGAIGPDVGAGVAAGITCANQLAQIAFAFARADIERGLRDVEQQQVWNEFRRRFEDRAGNVQDLASQMETARTQIRAELGVMEAERQRALRNVSKALLLDTDAAGGAAAVNNVMRRRYNTLLVRYERARVDAVRAAWLARRAVEQKLALRLNDLHEDMSLVDAPARWADELCTFTGIDYTRIRASNPMSAVEEDNYADAYIGDYVRKLENVVESYRLDFPFHDATDTAVVSIRDDVAHVRELCAAEVPNLLAFSSNLDLATHPEDHELLVWDVQGCTEDLPCVTVAPIGPAAADDFAIYPHSEIDGETGDLLPFEVRFNPPTTGRLVRQRRVLGEGIYRLSWYGKDPLLNSYDPALLFRAAIGGTTITDRSATGEAALAVPNETGWQRYWFLFRVTGPAGIEVDIEMIPLDPNIHAIWVAGPMLEDVTGEILGSATLSSVTVGDYPPREYVETTEAGIGQLPVCEDTDGTTFRGRWRSGCERLCPTGFGSCDEGEIHCYHEIPLDISVGGIEQGRLFGQSGFAHGNYNYRFDSIAVNLVGRNVRDCSRSRFPSSCYASGYVPYSIIHTGPFQVRNHRGEIYNAPLFDARIEHGRGLATERYLSNPLSSGDRAELTDFTHRELRGRPLTGHYVLRVWDTDGFVFENLEDVQVLLNYRYWTRFE